MDLDEKEYEVESEDDGHVEAPNEEELTLEERRALRRAKEEKFQKDMLATGKQIIEVGDDGNCLFRSIALQAYGDEDQHRLVRIKCMEYI